MFKLHDKTRRLLTLLIFLLLGPTLLIVVLARAAVRHSLTTVAEWEMVMTNAIGKRVGIESVAFPAPGVVRFSQFRVFDPQTNDVLLQIPQWELIEMNGKMPSAINGNVPQTLNKNQTSAENSQTAFYDPYLSRNPYKRNLSSSAGYLCSSLLGAKQRYYQCEIPQISCSETALPQIQQALNDLLAKVPYIATQHAQAANNVSPVVLYAGEINVFPKTQNIGGGQNHAEHVSPQESQSQLFFGHEWTEPITFKNLCAEFRPENEKTTFAAVFQSQEKHAAVKTLSFTASRERQTASANVTFAANETKIPTRWIASMFPFFECFGEQSQFSGELNFQESQEESKKLSRQLELRRVTFRDISLNRFLRNAVPFSVNGNAERLSLESATFRSVPNRSAILQLERAEGLIVNGSGNADWSGLRQLVQGTKLLITPPNASPPNADVSFRNCSFAFLFDADGIRIRPASQNSPLLSIDNHCEIRVAETTHFIRYNELLAALSRPAAPKIPLTEETRYLTSTLPVTANENANNELLTNSLTSSPRTNPNTNRNLNRNTNMIPDNSGYREENRMSEQVSEQTISEQPQSYPAMILPQEIPQQQYQQNQIQSPYQPQITPPQSYLAEQQYAQQQYSNQQSYSPQQQISEQQYLPQQQYLNQQQYSNQQQQNPPTTQPYSFPPQQQTAPNVSSYYSQQLNNVPPLNEVVPVYSQGNQQRVYIGRISPNEKLVQSNNTNSNPSQNNFLETPSQFNTSPETQIAAAPRLGSYYPNNNNYQTPPSSSNSQNSSSNSQNSSSNGTTGNLEMWKVGL